MRLALGCVLLLAACNPFKSGEVNGRIEASGSETGNWVLEKGACASGQREGYHGVIGYGPDGSGVAIKLVKDAVRGWTAVVNKADSCKTQVEKSACKAIILAPSDCTTLEVEVGPTNTTINDVKVVEGTLKIDCTIATSTIKGQLTFSYCH